MATQNARSPRECLLSCDSRSCIQQNFGSHPLPSNVFNQLAPFSLLVIDAAEERQELFMKTGEFIASRLSFARRFKQDRHSITFAGKKHIRDAASYRRDAAKPFQDQRFGSNPF